jgi:hypothetical protein
MGGRSALGGAAMNVGWNVASDRSGSTALNSLKWVLILGAIGYFVSGLLLGEDWRDITNVGKWFVYAMVALASEAVWRRRQSRGGGG